MNDANHQEFLRLVALNPTLGAVLDRLDTLDLPDAWLAGGCLFQTAWNALAGHDPARGIKDYDLFYFDAVDCSKAAEDAVNRRIATQMSDLGCAMDARNQARVHLWYAQEFGTAGYPRLSKTTDGIDHFLAVCCMVGIQRSPTGEIRLHAPLGVQDILSRIMRPNPWFPTLPVDAYNMKASRWRELWPELSVIPPDPGPELPAYLPESGTPP